MITVQFNFKTILEAQEFLEGLSGRQLEANPSPKVPLVPEMPSKHSEPETVVTVAHPVPSVDKPVFVGIDFAAPEKKKRGPKPKAALPDVIYGIEDCRAALSNLFDTKGREVAKTVLMGFGANRVIDLKADKYALFIERCQAASAPE